MRHMHEMADEDLLQYEQDSEGSSTTWNEDSEYTLSFDKEYRFVVLINWYSLSTAFWSMYGNVYIACYYLLITIFGW